MTTLLEASAVESPVLEDGLLLALEQAYELGSSRASPKFPDEDEDVRLQAEWKNGLRYADMTHVPPAERQMLAAGKLACEKARKAAMSGDPGNAIRELAIAEARFQHLRSSAEAAMHGRLEWHAAAAAVAYQARDYEQSGSHLEAARQTDRRLVEEHGSVSAQAHGFHLLAKTVQLDAARGDLEHAMATAAITLLALSGLSISPNTTIWPQGSPLLLAAPIRRLLARQIAAEIGAALLPAFAAARARAIGTLNHALPNLRTLDLDSPTREWLHAKLLSETPGAAATHLEACRAFLENRRRTAETLWLMAALDVARRCAELPSPVTPRLCIRIYADLATHTAFAPRLRAGWSRLAGTPALDEDCPASH